MHVAPAVRDDSTLRTETSLYGFTVTLIHQRSISCPSTFFSVCASGERVKSPCCFLIEMRQCDPYSESTSYWSQLDSLVDVKCLSVKFSSLQSNHEFDSLH